MSTEETPIYAVEMQSSREDIAILSELLSTLDLPPTAVSSYEDLEKDCGTTFILCDTPAEQHAARRQLESMLPLWEPLLSAPLGGITERPIKREDWSESWKKYFHPFRASTRLVIKPTWEDYQAEPGDVLLEIDPGMCFGTGSHGTTKGCLQYIDDIAAEFNAPLTMIDAGCGSSILSMAARKLGYGRIFAFDYDPQAMIVSRENLDFAHIDDVELAQGDVHDIVPPFQADVVIVNILAHILLEAKENILSMVKPGGILILSGILNQQYPATAQAFIDLGCTEVDHKVLTDWTSGRFIVPGATSSQRTQP